MLTSEFDYDLPAELIAQEPVARGQSRLFVVGGSEARRHRSVADLPELLEEGDLLVVNDTRVLPARLFGRLPTGGRVELLLVEREGPTEWVALVKPGRRARPGTTLSLSDRLTVTILAKLEDGRHRMAFSEAVEPHLAELGHVPLPPYIKRPDEPSDAERYQTIYASVDGAIAAPTAGLHFTPGLLDRIRRRGVRIEKVTLHVGIGTFKPVTAKLVHEHQMEEERFEIPEAVPAAVESTRRRGGRVVAVGTTVVRALEGAARPNGALDAGSGRTALFITPGYAFRIVDRLLTNFHLPRSTLLMLVAAFAGRELVLAAYAEAIEQRYRFYSYGDAMFLERG